MDYALFLPAAALLLDLALGDPPSRPHPVRLIGWALDRLEAIVQPSPPIEGARGESSSPAGAGRKPGGVRAGASASSFVKRLHGLCVALFLSLAAYVSVTLLGRIPHLGWLFSLYFAYAGLALGQLLREAGGVSRLIESGDLDRARTQLSYLVSRDTSVLDEPGLWRTLAETVSENFCDAFVAPFFYLCLGGPGLLWAYKAISTMDSMWGYKTDRFRALGWAGARGDDLLAYLPARLAAYAMIAVGFAMGLAARSALRSFAGDARRMSSPNAGWPMAAAAWLCGATMGGPAVYFGRVVDKPILGPRNVKWSIFEFKILTKLVFFSAIAVAVTVQLLVAGLGSIFS